MHIAIIIDEERLNQEQSMLNRLCIGLMAEGVQVTRIVPDVSTAEPVDEGEQRVALATRIEAPMRVLPWMRSSRSKRIVDALNDRMPDILYAVGDEAWPVGIDLATAIGKPMLVDVWSASQAKRVPRTTAPVAGYVVPCSGIASALERSIERSLISIVPMGVSIPESPRQPLSEPDRAAAVTIIGSGRDLSAYQALLAGLSRVVREFPATQIFLELQGPREHEIWRHAERLELLGFISAIGEASHYRSLVTRCDLLLIPERFGELYSLMLEAMALGVSVVSCADTSLDMLVDGETASIVERSDADVWFQQIGRLLRAPESARLLGQKARSAITSRFRSSDQVLRLIETFEKALSGGALSFAPKMS